MLKQIGVEGIVTALHDVPLGQVWTQEAIHDLKTYIESYGMRWSVVESLPVVETIKYGGPDRDEQIEVYKESLRNLGKEGIHCVCYNFMPVLDWARTDLHKVLPDGSVTLAYDQYEVCAFEMFVLKRPGLEKNYDDATRARARRLWGKASARERKRIADALLTGLPGTTEDATPEGLRRELAAYADIDAPQLKRNLYAFLNEITPTLEETGIDMAIHPDDPPFPIFGLPRILSSAADIREMARACPSRHVGVTLCTGSLGANLKNDAVKIFREFHERIHFCHFRNLLHSEPGVFRESDSHLVGNTDMPALMFELLKEERRRGAEIVVRPDHGRMLDADKGRTCYYGYSYGGRLIGLSELRGLEAGLKYKPRRGLPKRA